MSKDWDAIFRIAKKLAESSKNIEYYVIVKNPDILKWMKQLKRDKVIASVGDKKW